MKTVQTKKSHSTRATYDAQTAERVRTLLRDRTDVVEKRMFGGLCFMVGGKMCCGLTKTDFMVRVGKDAFAEAVSQPHARPMDFTGRASTSSVYVAPAGYATDAALASWVDRGLALCTEPSARELQTDGLKDPGAALPNGGHANGKR